MQDVEMIRLLVVDSRVLVGSGVATILERNLDFQVIGQATSAEEAFRVIDIYLPDVVTIDIDIPDALRGLEVIQALRSKFSKIRIVVLTNLMDEVIVRAALRQGIAGYFLKNASIVELADAIRSAYHGRPCFDFHHIGGGGW